MHRIMMWALCWSLPIVLCADGNGGGIGVQTIKVSSVSPLLTLKFWDYEAEDGDWVRIVVDGVTYREFELKNAPKTVSVPILFSDKDEVFVNVIGTRSGNGPVTYAVQATGLGSSMEVYKNYANVGSGNSYRIVKTKDDIFSVGVGFITDFFDKNGPEPLAPAIDCSDFHDEKQAQLSTLEESLERSPSLPESFVKGCLWVQAVGHALAGLTPQTGMLMSGVEMARSGINDLMYGDVISTWDTTQAAHNLKGNSYADKVVENADLVIGENWTDEFRKAKYMRPEKASQVRHAYKTGVAAKAYQTGMSVAGAAIDGYDLGQKYAKIEQIYERKRSLEEKIRNLKKQKCPVCGGY